MLEFESDSQFAAAIAFIDMMDEDDSAAAQHAAEALDAVNVTFFHDPGHQAGLALARCLGWRHHVAWDAHFFYARGTRWEGDTPPEPSEWFHQLRDREAWEERVEAATGSAEWTSKLAEKSEADPTRFRTGNDLAKALREAIEWAVCA